MNRSFFTTTLGFLILAIGPLQALAKPVTAINLEDFHFGWKPPVTFTVVDTAVIAKSTGETTSTNTVVMKFLMKFRAHESGTSVLNWARADLMRVNELTPGKPGFSEVADSLAKLWAATPGVLINHEGQPTGLVGLDAMPAAMGKFFETFNLGSAEPTQKSYSNTFKTANGQQALLGAVSKSWVFWTIAWKWDPDQAALRKLVDERNTDIVRISTEAPIANGTDPVPVNLEYAFLGLETNGLVHLSYREEFPPSRLVGGSMVSFINSIASEDAKLDPGVAESSEVGKHTELEAILDPALLQPSWVRTVETITAKEANGVLHSKREVHDYRFNFSPPPDEIRPGAAWSRQMHAELENDRAKQHKPIWAVLGVSTFFGVAIGIAMFAIWLIRSTGNRRDRQTGKNLS
ncbi:hypothetical protein GC207_05200 [bacterium]|nr:hypothetical protein [bacterium]